MIGDQMLGEPEQEDVFGVLLGHSDLSLPRPAAIAGPKPSAAARGARRGWP
jgi:hypothetical protein